MLIQYSVIDMIATGGTFSADFSENLIAAAAPDHLKIRASLNGSWAAVRVVVHDGPRPQAVESTGDWEEMEDTEVIFSGPPFFYVDFNVGWNVEPSLHDLGAPAGAYTVRVSANGVNEARRMPVTQLVELDEAPPPEKLLQQFRIDMWPVSTTNLKEG